MSRPDEMQRFHGAPDFIFQNSFDQPVMIQTEVNQGELIVRVVSNAP